MEKMWIRYRAVYTTWGEPEVEKVVESVEESAALFVEKLEKKLARSRMFFKTLNIESIQAE